MNNLWVKGGYNGNLACLGFDMAPRATACWRWRSTCIQNTSPIKTGRSEEPKQKENHQSFRDVQIEKDEEATKTMKLVKQPRIQFPGDLIANCGLSARKFCEGNITATQ